MSVLLIGATGAAGTRILDELLRRGRTVTALVRRAERLTPRQGLSVVGGDVNDPDVIAPILFGHEAVITATRFLDIEPAAFIRAVKAACVPHLLVVGGAGTLYARPGIQRVDEPEFNPAVRPESLAGRAFLTALQAEHELNWSFLSPSANFEPGQRTATYRLGTDDLLIGADGRSAISFEDYAVALVDELDSPRHLRRRFTVGY
ncbi:NAD(P)-dependent oxidoreductase [Celeribacter indicus]|uniref:NAD-dependent epimerase/dehydratase n=1 Tax=Celeribacter indicus TaxID=1208324 RepID=A0A0B5E0H8_9RHOB|nr:NAD(P)H-binding protein [Celeribacter indicus]AJE48754.1 NAD-dependent epimerase/dehydratase [Celeribacter indicus]SDX11392.1 hypothetical protein SAMN05443573_11427 [Celeribacter indicus]